MKLLDIKSDWNEWTSDEWLDAFPILEAALPNVNVVVGCRNKFMNYDKLPTATQVKLMKDYYSEKIADELESQKQLQESIRRTKEYAEANKRVFNGDLSIIKDWVVTFEASVAMTDYMPAEDDLLTYYFKKRQLDEKIGIPNNLQDAFYAKYGADSNVEAPVDKISPTERVMLFDKIFEEEWEF